MTYLTEHPSKYVGEHTRNSQAGIHTSLWRAYLIWGVVSTLLTFMFCYYLDLGKL